MLDLICWQTNREIALTFWYFSVVDSPFSHAERPSRRAPEITRRMNPRIVRVTITSSSVNPVVARKLLLDVWKPFSNLITFLFPPLLIMSATGWTHLLHKSVPKGSWVCWKAFTTGPFNLSLLCFQTHFKGHFEYHRMLPIKNMFKIHACYTSLIRSDWHIVHRHMRHQKTSQLPALIQSLSLSLTLPPLVCSIRQDMREQLLCQSIFKRIQKPELSGIFKACRPLRPR